MRRHEQYRRVSPRFEWWVPAWMVVFAALTHAQARAQAQPPVVRTWTSGDYQVQAKFVSVAGGTVTLEQSDGEVLIIPLEKLSAADQEYVKQQQKMTAANPFKKKSESPFRTKGGSAASAGGTGNGHDAGSERSVPGRLVKPNWDGVETIAGTPATTGWSITVVPLANPATPPRLRPVPVPPKGGFFEGPRGVALNAAGTRAAVGYAGANPGPNQRGNSRVALCDLESGKLLGSGSQPGVFAPLALSDDGTQVLMRTDAFGDGHDRLEFWSVSRSGVVQGDQWVPYEARGGMVMGRGGGEGDPGVRWAAFLDSGRIATVSEAGKLVIWQVKPLKPLAVFSVQSGCTPALSPDRKLLAFATAKDIGLLDLAALEVTAVRPAPMPNMAWTTFTFSPTGKRLACKVFVSRVFVYEVADGALYREISLQGLNAQNHPAVFPDDGHLILAGHTLVDLESQVRLWDYQGNERVVTASGLCWFEVAASQNQAGALVPAKIPQPGVQEALTRAARDPNFFIFKPGSTVTIDVNGIPDAAQRNNVIQSLTASLARVGVKVGPGSPVAVQAALERGKEEEIAYRSFGGGFRSDRFKVVPWLSKLKITYEGKTVWDTAGSSVPHFEMVQLQKDESLQDHVRKFEEPNYKFFGSAELPKLLTRPTGRGSGTLGVSQVTLSGIR